MNKLYTDVVSRFAPERRQFAQPASPPAAKHLRLRYFMTE